MRFSSIILLTIALFLESTLTTIPLIFLVLLSLTVLFRNNRIFLLAFVFGMLFDLISFNILGISSLFYIIFLFLVLIYQRKFEIATNYFILISSFLGSLGFLIVLGYNNSVILQAVFSSFLGFLIFKLFQRYVW